MGRGMVNTSPVGLVGRVVTRIRGGAQPGEVRVVHGGLPHDYLAYSTDQLAVGTAVLVLGSRGSRQLDVEPWNEPGLSVDLDAAGGPGRP